MFYFNEICTHITWYITLHKWGSTLCFCQRVVQVWKWIKEVKTPETGWMNMGLTAKVSVLDSMSLNVSSLQIASVFVFLYKHVHIIFLNKKKKITQSFLFCKMFSKFTLITRLCIFLSCATLSLYLFFSKHCDDFHCIFKPFLASPTGLLSNCA